MCDGAMGGLFLTMLERVQCGECSAPIAAFDAHAKRVVTFGVDSGASATVLTEDECKDYPLDRAHTASYQSACKKVITTLGRRILKTKDGDFIRTEVGPVSKHLMCVTDLCDSGHRVVFDAQEGYQATHKRTGRVLGFTRVGKTFNFNVEVPTYDPAAFRRRGVHP